MSAAPQLLKILKISLEVVKGPNAGQRVDFEKNTITLGRGPENDFVFANDVKTSRQHVELKVLPSQVIVRNLSQKNPIALDGELVNEKAARPGSVLRFGESEVKIHFEKPNVDLMAVANTSSGVTNLRPPPTTPHAVGSVVHGSVAGIGVTSPTPRSVAMPRRNRGSRLPLYVIIAVVIGGAYWLSQDSARKKNHIQLRDHVSTETAISSSQSEYEKAIQNIEKKGQDTVQYRLSQEQYLKGFRDYRQGQYVRAMEEFQASLSFYPTHEMSRKYYTLAKRKFDEQIQFNMIQGKRYYGVSNYRLCMGFYSNVIKMKKDEKDPIRREALQYYRECEIKMREKF